MFIDPISVSRQRLVENLKAFETQDSKTLLVALDVVKAWFNVTSTKISLQDLSISSSLDNAQEKVIQDLFTSILELKDPSNLSWIQNQGVESLQELVQMKLEHILWNHIEGMTNPDPTYQCLAPFLAVEDFPQEIPPFPSSKKAGKKQGVENISLSFEEQFNHFAKEVEKWLIQLKHSSSFEEDQQLRGLIDLFIKKTTDKGKARRDELETMEKAFARFKEKVEKKLPFYAETPPKTEEERKALYEKFAKRFAISFIRLLEREKQEEEYLLLQIPGFVEACETGWEQQTAQMVAYTKKDSEYALSPTVLAQKRATQVRRAIVQEALRQAFLSHADDVHYIQASRYAFNEEYYLGFSPEELGIFEQDVVLFVRRQCKIPPLRH